MARVHPIFPTFTTGELSPLMMGRVDFAKYASGLQLLLNYIIRPHGPVARRPGTHFIAEVKFSNLFTRMMKFEFSTTQAYQIEAGNLYMRFYKNGGRIEVPVANAANNGSGLIRITATGHGINPGQQVTIYGVTGTTEANATWTITVIDANNFDLQGSTFTHAYNGAGSIIPEVVTPYIAADLPLVKYVQSADTVYLVHPLYPVQKLQRQGHTAWTFAPVKFLPPPTYEAGFTLTGSITLSATSGLGITVSNSGNDFVASDVQRVLTFPGVAALAGLRIAITAITNGTAATGDILDNGVFPSTSPGLGGNLNGSPNPATLTPSIVGPAHAIATFTASVVAFRATDVGLIIRCNHGTAQIIAQAGTTATCEILTVLTNVTASPPGSWSLESPEFSAIRGYPRAIAFFEQRLLLAGTVAKPITFWGSDTAQYEVFGLGPDDDDAYSYNVATNDVNTINWMLPTRVLLIGTASAEFSATGNTAATSAAITPSNIDLKPSTFWGGHAAIQPIRVGNAGLFVTRTGTELREMVFSLQRDAYVADDMLLLSEHLTKGVNGQVIGLADMCYQRHPNSTLWFIRSDGVALTCTYQREHDVVGWARQITGPDMQTITPVKGKFESCITTTHWNLDRDVVFFTVNRNINGVQKRYVEYLDDLNGFYGNMGVDAGLLYSGAPTTSVTGLTHLIGETVQILGDGAVYPTAVVDNTGTITLVGPSASQIEAGLQFNSIFTTMRVEVPQQGTSQGVIKHWAKVFVRCFRTIGMFIDGEEIPFRSAQNITGQAPPLFTGDVEHSRTTRDRDGTVTVEQRQPLPQVVLSIFGILNTGD